MYDVLYCVYIYCCKVLLDRGCLLDSKTLKESLRSILVALKGFYISILRLFLCVCIIGDRNNNKFNSIQFQFIEAPTAEACRSRSTGVDSGRSWRFPTGSRAGPGVDILDWNRSRSRSEF